MTEIANEAKMEAERLKTYPSLNVLELKRKIENRLLVEKYLLLKNCEFEQFERHLENISERI